MYVACSVTAVVQMCCVQSVIVKSIERNARNMYLARLLLLGLHPEGLSGSLLKAAANNTHSSAGLGLTTLGKLCFIVYKYRLGQLCYVV